jgi:uncharacterized protein (TIGR02246 family)
LIAETASRVDGIHGNGVSFLASGIGGLAMRRLIIAFTIIVIGGWSVAPTRTVAQPAKEAAEEKVIRQLSKQWDAAVATKDPAAIVKFYTDDGVLLPQGAALAEGHDAIAKVWRGFFDLPDFSLTFSPTKINVSSSGDMAYEIGTYALSFRSNKGPVHEKGKYVVVWKKAGGTWRAAADIFNNNGTAP